MAKDELKGRRTKSNATERKNPPKTESKTTKVMADSKRLRDPKVTGSGYLGLAAKRKRLREARKEARDAGDGPLSDSILIGKPKTRMKELEESILSQINFQRGRRGGLFKSPKQKKKKDKDG